MKPNAKGAISGQAGSWQGRILVEALDYGLWSMEHPFGKDSRVRESITVICRFDIIVLELRLMYLQLK